MSGCPNPDKQRHDTRRAAQAHARSLQRAGASVDVQPYRCPCGAWHVGHSVASLRFRIREARRKGIA